MNKDAANIRALLYGVKKDVANIRALLYGI
jgi:hypothetical protein